MQRKLQWQCTAPGCKKSYPPTEHGYNQIRGHGLRGHKKEARGYQLVDAESGEVLAQDLDEAREKGLLELEKPQPPAETVAPAEELLGTEAEEEVIESAEEQEEEEEEPSEEPPRGKEKAEKEGREVKEISSDGIFRYTITLPADAFALFNIAKANGLEKDGKIFDEFVWDCITARFEKDYKKQLILAPIEES